MEPALRLWPSLTAAFFFYLTGYSEAYYSYTDVNNNYYFLKNCRTNQVMVFMEVWAFVRGENSQDSCLETLSSGHPLVADLRDSCSGYRECEFHVVPPKPIMVVKKSGYICGNADGIRIQFRCIDIAQRSIDVCSEYGRFRPAVSIYETYFNSPGYPAKFQAISSTFLCQCRVRINFNEAVTIDIRDSSSDTKLSITSEGDLPRPLCQFDDLSHDFCRTPVTVEKDLVLTFDPSHSGTFLILLKAKKPVKSYLRVSCSNVSLTSTPQPALVTQRLPYPSQNTTVLPSVPKSEDDSTFVAVVASVAVFVVLSLTVLILIFLIRRRRCHRFMLLRRSSSGKVPPALITLKLESEAQQLKRLKSSESAAEENMGSTEKYYSTADSFSDYSQETPETEHHYYLSKDVNGDERIYQSLKSLNKVGNDQRNSFVKEDPYYSSTYADIQDHTCNGSCVDMCSKAGFGPTSSGPSTAMSLKSLRTDFSEILELMDTRLARSSTRRKIVDRKLMPPPPPPPLPQDKIIVSEYMRPISIRDSQCNPLTCTELNIDKHSVSAATPLQSMQF